MATRSEENIRKTLSAVPIFGGLPAGPMDRIVSISVVRDYARGEMIFWDGDPADGFYVLMAGQVKIFKVSPEGREKILHIFGPGEPFGEVPVFSGGSFPANAEALAESRLIFFPRKAFVDLIGRNPSIALSLLAVLSMRLRQFTVQIENLSLKEVPERLAGYLMFLAGEQGTEDAVTLDISKGQLASLLGTIPETLSRIFAKMSGDGLIEVDGRTIRLLDPDRLAFIAEHGRRAEALE
jgi:CRP/FNR family transcriptional regulator, dissimilatory nitrate respiration regulator